MNEMNTHPIYKSFVHPAHSEALHHAGLQLQAPFMWRTDNGTAQLFCGIFDPDGIYEQAAANLSYVTDSIVRTFAAYQLEDLEMLLPDYTICRTGTEYALCMGVEWHTECVITYRLPDAFAMMVLQLYKEKKLDLKKATELITKK